ncbi:MAG TPA: hypothetical protein VIV88_09665 [Gemmatimonadales bacterium]
MDVLEGPGFRLERRGRYIHTTTSRTPEEHRALIERMAASVDELKAELERRAAEIQERLSQFDTFTVLGALSLQNHLVDPETYEESSHEGKSFVAEYTALLALKSNYSTGTKLYANGAALRELQEKTEQALQTVVWLQMARAARQMLVAADASGTAAPTPDAIADLQMTMRLNELAVRNPAYPHHHHQVLRGLFTAFEDELVDALGFSVDDAIKLSDAIPARMSRRFQDRAQKASRGFKQLEIDVNRARKGRTRAAFLAELDAATDDDARKHGAFALELAKRSRKDVRRYLKYAAGEWVILDAAAICSFTVKELAAEAGVADNRAAAFLQALAVDFGQLPGDFVEPVATHLLRARPIVRHQDRYIAPAPLLLDWAIQPVFEAALNNPSPRASERYRKHRHDYLLHTAMALLKRLMPEATLATNLHYDVEGDRSRRAELDGLSQYDSMVFLLEAKGQDFTEPARRGAPDRLRRDLKEVIAASHEQAVRAKAHLDAARALGPPREARFRRADGGPDVIVTMDSVRHVILISVTLAPIGHLTAQLHAASPICLFRPGEYSWVASIYDLMVIADILGLAAAFPHYLARRVQTAHLGLLEAADELDIFGYYLAEGLYLDDVAKTLRRDSAKASFRLLSYTGPFDAYYAHATGARQTPAPKPALRIPLDVRALLERLDSSGLPRRLDAALAILDLDGGGRDAFARNIERARQITTAQRRPSNATIAGRGDGGWGITYWCDVTPEAVAGALEAYCERKRGEHGAQQWLGIGEVVGRDSRRVVSVVLNTDARP